METGTIQRKRLTAFGKTIINNYNPLKLYYYETNSVYLYGDGDRVAVHEGTDRV